jgi:acyl-ACP thioesterase
MHFRDFSAATVRRVLTPRPAEGRTFTMGRRVRLGDVSPAGRLRLDAIARYLQDVSSDDVADAALVDGDAWVVRRILVHVERWAVFRESIDLTTWCSGLGSRWAERRVSIAGEHGAAIEAATLWVFVDLESGRPRRLPAGFDALFGAAAGGRTVSARLRLPGPAARTQGTPWPLRFCDFDVLGHVNNAAYWTVVEEELAARRNGSRGARGPLSVEMEYGAGIDRGEAVEVVVEEGSGGELAMWLLDGTTGAIAASIRVRADQRTT